MNHFDIVAGSTRTDPFRTRDVGMRSNFGRNCLEYWLDVRPGISAATRHQAGAFQGSFFTPGNSRSDIQQSFLFDVQRASLRIEVMCIAAIDHNVAC